MHVTGEIHALIGWIRWVVGVLIKIRIADKIDKIIKFGQEQVIALISTSSSKKGNWNDETTP